MKKPALSTPPHTPTRSLVGLAELPVPTLRALLTSAHACAKSLAHPKRIKPVLSGRIIANLFFEDSTRTRTSFSIAAKRLGAEVVDLMGFASSVNKGETLQDTARTIEAMGVDALVIRAKQSGAADNITHTVRCPVINAGDGRHEHPTQGLLDAYTFAAAHDRVDDFNFKGLRVLIVGDIASSRVARSAIIAMSRLGAKVTCIGPPGLAPRALEHLGCTVEHELDPHLATADAVMMLRMQFERHEGTVQGGTSTERPPEPKKSAAVASIREFRAFYALTGERACRLKPSCIVMHPGPMNRGLEIDGSVADSPRSRVLAQVSHGVAIRMAVLKWCLSTE